MSSKPYKYILFSFLIIIGLNSYGQSWITRTVYPGNGMRSSTGFNIGTKGYIVNGSNGVTNSTQLWEYDNITNGWTQKANFPGTGRRLGTSFTIGTDAYVGLGWNGAVTYTNMYKYNSLTNTWSQIADYPGVGGAGAKATSVNGLGYVIGGNQSGVGPFNEFYEYNPATDTWRQINNFPIGARSEGIAETIGNEIYFGLGHNYINDFDDLWKYNPVTNTWVQLASMPGPGRLNAMSFVVNGELVTGGGYQLGSGVDQGDYYRYFPAQNTWESICGFTSGDRSNASAFVIGNLGYIIGGWRSNNIRSMFEYTPPVTLNTDTFYCEGSILDLNVRKAGYSYQWFDNTTSPNYQISQPGIYWVAYDRGGCKSRENFNVTERPAPKVNLGIDTVFCSQIPYVLDATQPNNFSTYSWQNNSKGSTFSVNNTGIYWVDVTTNGCTVRDSVSITYNQSPVVTLGGDKVICDGDQLVLDATYVGATYLWNDNSTTPTLSISDGGTYWVEVTADGCTTKDTVTVTKYNKPVINLGNDITICNQRPLILDSKISTNGALFKWQDGSTNSTLAVNKTGEYWVEVTLGTCVTRDSIVVTYSEISSISLGEDKVECEGDEVILDVTFPGATYLWQDNSTQPIYTVTKSGLYWVTVSKDGCVKLDSVNIIFSTTPVVDFGNDTLICSTDSLILDATFSNASYRWQNGSRNAKMLILKTGTYSVTANVGRCSAADTINVTFIKAPKLNFGEDKVMCFGDDHVIYLEPNYVDYLWQDGSEKSRYIIEDPGTYSVYASNICGTDSDTIRIDYRNCECDIFMPNAFSPNGDGHNEQFGTTYECTYVNYKFQIYNRWGQLLFETRNQDQKWDGTFGGKMSPPGNYIYSIKYSLKPDGLFEEFSGSFLLIR